MKDEFETSPSFFQGSVEERMKKAHVVAAALVLTASLWLVLRREKFLGFQDFSEFGALTPLATGAPGSRKSWDNMLPTTYPLVPGYVGTPIPEPEMRAAETKDGGTCWCPRAHPYDFRDAERDTVCVKATGQAFSNRCAANCYGFSDPELYACKPRMALYRLG